MRGEASPDFSQLLRVADELGDAVRELSRGASRCRNVHEWLALRAGVGVRMGMFHRAVNDVSTVYGVSNATDRLLVFLCGQVGTVVDKDQLAGVAGIHEWARRLRELRVEKGWPIASGATRDDLRPGQYVLESDAPDLALAADWATAKTVRAMKGSGKDRLLAYLHAVHPRAADKERLAYVARINDWPRRVRELVEEGWQIRSVLDDAALLPGDYRLASTDRLPARQRKAIKLRHEILERDGFACRDCGRTAVDGVQLEVHHIVLVSEGGTNDAGNLLTLCSVCHAGRHAVRRGTTRDELVFPASELDVKVR